MKTFISPDFLLESAAARSLYNDYAKEMPIIDFHSHLSPEMIWTDYQFRSVTELWLGDDHYKWRAMRMNGIEERFCTGEVPDWERFEKWAETVPYTIRNPLFHWTHMELKNVFGVDRLLTPETALSVYEECNEKLRDPSFSVYGLLRRFNVKILCTTDDPTDTLEYHEKLGQQKLNIRMLPTWRPDQILKVEEPSEFCRYVDKLSEASRITILNYYDLIDALRCRHDYFGSHGCCLSDHGLDEFCAEEYTESEICTIFNKVYSGNCLSVDEIKKIKSALLMLLAELDWEKGWVQQFHYGALRDKNQCMLERLGIEKGFDSMSETNTILAMIRFFNKLNSKGRLAKTIVYNINPGQNEVLITALNCFQDGITPGKMQMGAAWWFLDQKQGIEKQLNDLSSLGLLSRFVGMVTDSRSFLSFSRHDYFRRILCNIIGKDIEKGELPDDLDFIGYHVRNICYYNAKSYLSL